MKYFILVFVSLLLLSFKTENLNNLNNDKYDESINQFLEKTKIKYILNNIANFQVYKIETFNSQCKTIIKLLAFIIRKDNPKKL